MSGREAEPIDVLLGIATEYPKTAEADLPMLYANPLICTPQLYAAAAEAATDEQATALGTMLQKGHLVLAADTLAARNALHAPVKWANRATRRKDAKRK